MPEFFRLKVTTYILLILTNNLSDQSVNSSCSGDNCSHVLFYQNSNLIQPDVALDGFSLETIRVSNEDECFTECIERDCKCISFNFNISVDENGKHTCELNYENEENIPSALKTRKRFRYFGIQSNIERLDKSCLKRTCTNDCCLFNPCKHGKCTEICTDVRRFKCSCEEGYAGLFCEQKVEENCSNNPCFSGGTCVEIPDGYRCLCAETFLGKQCEHQAFSCKDIYQYEEQVPKTDYHKIANITDNHGKVFPVLCHFRPAYSSAFTLVMSYSFANNIIFKNQPLTRDLPRNENKPNWYDYRISKDKMAYIKSKPGGSWAISCDYQNQGLNTDKDYFRMKFKTFDILTEIGNTSCLVPVRNRINRKEFSYIKISQDESKIVHVIGSCNESTLEYKAFSFKYFGYYEPNDISFSCSSSSASTTQLWFRSPAN